MSEEYYILHECDHSNSDTRQIVFSKDIENGFENAWNLCIRRLANEQDLEENHYLESEGDIIWQTTVEILYCPFCGAKLEGARKFEGEVSLYEGASGWYGKNM